MIALTTATRFDLKSAMQQVATDRPEVQELTFRELVEAWLATRRNDGRSHSRFQKWLRAFGDVRAWDISSEDLATATKAMQQAGYAPCTTNRELSGIGEVFNWANAERICPPDFKSPTLGMSRAKEEIRFVEIKDDVRARLLALAKVGDKRFAIFVHLLADTGARKSELLERTWGEIDLERREIHLLTSKNGKARTLFFSEATAALIRRFAPSRPAHALAFPGRVPDQPCEYRRSWAALTLKAGCPDLHQHDLRHDKARRLLLAGTPVAVAAGIMGHSVQVLLSRYGHLVADDHRSAVEKLFGQAA